MINTILFNNRLAKYILLSFIRFGNHSPSVCICFPCTCHSFSSLAKTRMNALLWQMEQSQKQSLTSEWQSVCFILKSIFVDLIDNVTFFFTFILSFILLKL